MKRINPHHDPKHRYAGGLYKKMAKQPQKDNDVTRYLDGETTYYGKIISCDTLEETIRKAIRKERDWWRTPYTLVEAEDYAWDFPDDQKKYVREYANPADCETIRDMLDKDDAYFRSTSLAKRQRYVRVPSLKRSNREWMNFYRTWPWIAAKVAIGEERFADGAKLKYMPLFKEILDQEWPEDLKMWTEYQYDQMIKNGQVKESYFTR